MTAIVATFPPHLCKHCICFPHRNATWPLIPNYWLSTWTVKWLHHLPSPPRPVKGQLRLELTA